MVTTLLLIVSILTEASGRSVDQHIVNGDVVEPHTYPWQLSLQHLGHHVCGAVLINTQYALTAAHCVDITGPGTDRVQCGVHNIHIHENDRQDAAVTGLRVHPGYDPNSAYPSYPHDIAVLRLDRYLRQDEKCSPAVLASGPEDYTDADATITGWGFVYDGSYTPSRLKEGKVKVLHPSDCSWRWGHNVNSTVHVCLKDLGNKVYGMCHGDSGGPAQVGNVVIGLASFMGSGCLTDYPSVYVRISSHIDWILGAIAELANE